MRISRSWVQVQKPYLDNVCSLKTWIILKSVFVYYIRKNKHTSKNTLPNEDRETWMNKKITYTQTIMYGLRYYLIYRWELRMSTRRAHTTEASIISNHSRLILTSIPRNRLDFAICPRSLGCLVRPQIITRVINVSFNLIRILNYYSNMEQYLQHNKSYTFIVQFPII